MLWVSSPISTILMTLKEDYSQSTLVSLKRCNTLEANLELLQPLPNIFFQLYSHYFPWTPISNLQLLHKMVIFFMKHD